MAIVFAPTELVIPILFPIAIELTPCLDDPAFVPIAIAFVP